MQLTGARRDLIQQSNGATGVADRWRLKTEEEEFEVPNLPPQGPKGKAETLTNNRLMSSVTQSIIKGLPAGF